MPSTYWRMRKIPNTVAMLGMTTAGEAIDEMQLPHENEQREHRDLGRDEQPEEQETEQPVPAGEAQLGERVARHRVDHERGRVMSAETRTLFPKSRATSSRVSSSR